MKDALSFPCAWLFWSVTEPGQLAVIRDRWCWRDPPGEQQTETLCSVHGLSTMAHVALLRSALSSIAVQVTVLKQTPKQVTVEVKGIVDHKYVQAATHGSLVANSSWADQALSTVPNGCHLPLADASSREQPLVRESWTLSLASGARYLKLESAGVTLEPLKAERAIRWDR